MSDDDGSALRSEVQAFYAGFGQPGLLVAALREAVLLVPVTEDDRVCTYTVGGVRWIAGFTGVGELAGWLARRGVGPEGEYRYHRLWGWRLTGYAAALPEPAGVMVDAGGAAPVAFPPGVGEDAATAVGVR
ncbi:hypothetical protein [Nocardia sp. BMG51109]|uniref:hypothetical protein n=1 Tax=Nocardia sp. BMG51109 TaxID=1056816 RepID=UPI000463CE4E|nr:hypothetical protein [Nocardia sp. BMG51109]